MCRVLSSERVCSHHRLCLTTSCRHLLLGPEMQLQAAAGCARGRGRGEVGGQGPRDGHKRCLGQRRASVRNEPLPECPRRSSKPLCHFGSLAPGPTVSQGTALATLPFPNVLRISWRELCPRPCEHF